MSVSSQAYWNDIEIEKTKPYWVEDPSDTKLLRFLREETNLERCLRDALGFAAGLRPLSGRVLDVGAGVAWSSAMLSVIEGVREVVATDLSSHRLLRVAPIVFKQMGGVGEKFVSVVDDFRRKAWGPASFDMVLFVQSLYMFPDLKETLGHAHRLLVSGGLVVVACERIVPDHSPFSFGYYRTRLRRLFRGRADVSGNHGYVDREYREAIQAAGFDYRFQVLDYPVYPATHSLRAGNHFGIKAGPA